MGCGNSRHETSLPQESTEAESSDASPRQLLTQFQKELRTEVERAEESRALPKDPDRYNLMSSIKAVVDSGDVALLKGRWLVERSKSSPLSRRQDLESEAFWPASDLHVSADGFWLLEPMERRVMVIAVSYCWWTMEHPDPDGRQLQHLGHVLGSYLDQYRINLFGKDQVADTAVFLDWGSLHQEPRSEDEQAAYQRGVASMHLWFTHRKIKVWRMSSVPGPTPEGFVPYQDRGWPTFEREVSEMIHAYDDLVDVARFQIGKNYYQNREALQTQREPPLTPDGFRDVLKTRQFAISGDLDVVANLFQQAFLEVMTSTQVLAFNDLGWDDGKTVQCAKALPHCHNLQRLFLEGNNIGDEGAQALAEALLHCATLEHLRLNNNRIGSVGVAALKQAWQVAGKNAKYLAIHAQSRY